MKAKGSLKLKDQHGKMKMRNWEKEAVRNMNDMFSLRNDLLFHMVFSKSEKARIGLVAALLNIPTSDIVSATVENPMQYSERIDTKTTVLDLKVHLNNDRYLLIEMQVRRFAEWTNRTLVYACRQVADQVGKDFDYGTLEQVIQVSIMDNTLFADHKRFFSEYKIMDREGYMYTDKLKFMVLDLTAIEAASEEETKQGLVNWAKAFKAESWEDVQVIDDSNVKEAAKTMELIVKNPSQRELLRNRMDAINDQITAEASARKEGWNEGRIEGKHDGMIETLTNLVNKGIISPEDAAAEAGLSVQEFSQKYKKQ